MRILKGKLSPLLIIFLSVVLLLIAVSYFVFIRNTDPAKIPTLVPTPGSTKYPNNLQKYTNAEYGFSFKYPADWFLEETFMNGVVTKFHLAGTPTQQERLIYTVFPPLKLQIVPPERADRLTELFYVQTNPAINTKVGSVVGKKYDYDLNYGKRPRTAIILPIAEYKLILEMDAQFEDTLKQITDTFKFLEADLPPIIKSVPDKIFRNPEFGFEFQYPGTWLLYENTFSSGASRYNLSASAPENEDWAFNTPLLINIVIPDFVERQFSDLKDVASETVVDGVGGLRYEYEEQVLHITVILPLGEYKMILGTKKQYEDAFNQVLNTFKLLR
jgi:hypothetical protein